MVGPALLGKMTPAKTLENICVKIHKAQVKRASQLNQVSQMRARLESGLVNRTSHESFGSSMRTHDPLLKESNNESFGSFSYTRNQKPL